MFCKIVLHICGRGGDEFWGRYVPKNAGTAANAKPFGALEEEQFVLLYRTPNGVTKFVAGVAALCGVIRIIVVGVGGISGKPVKFPS